jgi:hypothetical protein
MTLTLILRKEEHTANDLRLLAQAPYFDAYLIGRRPTDNKHHPAAYYDHLADEELLPAGALLHSYSIARGTQRVLEAALGHQLPTMHRKEKESFMDPQPLHALLVKQPELQSDPIIGELYKLLKLATGLGFTVAWRES